MKTYKQILNMVKRGALISDYYRGQPQYQQDPTDIMGQQRKLPWYERFGRQVGQDISSAFNSISNRVGSWFGGPPAPNAEWLNVVRNAPKGANRKQLQQHIKNYYTNKYGPDYAKPNIKPSYVPGSFDMNTPRTVYGGKSRGTTATNVRNRLAAQSARRIRQGMPSTAAQQPAQVQTMGPSREDIRNYQQQLKQKRRNTISRMHGVLPDRRPDQTDMQYSARIQSYEQSPEYNKTRQQARAVYNKEYKPTEVSVDGGKGKITMTAGQAETWNAKIKNPDVRPGMQRMPSRSGRIFMSPPETPQAQKVADDWQSKQPPMSYPKRTAVQTQFGTMYMTDKQLANYHNNYSQPSNVRQVAASQQPKYYRRLPSRPISDHSKSLLRRYS